jgi:protocatechuate 3,4-dioxygenase beta subunit
MYVFVGLPASFGSPARIAPIGQQGERLHLRGRVIDPSGKPAAGVIVYAYHTNSAGIYPSDSALRDTSAARHGKLRGWARSNERGEYEFDTIRPGPYPGRRDPQHIHMHVIEPQRCTYYIGNVEFTDDPRLTPALRARSGLLRGGSGVVNPVRDAGGVWQASRDIHLGENIPGYASCG